MLTMIDNIILINWLNDSPYRIKVLKLLNVSPDFPKNISKELKIHKSSLSRVLGDLSEKELIDKITSSSRTKTYIITDSGKKILKEIDKNGN
jgi:DNA-binding MarR family transcriptional regulator